MVVGGAAGVEAASVVDKLQHKQQVKSLAAAAIPVLLSFERKVICVASAAGLVLGLMKCRHIVQLPAGCWG